MCAQTAALEAQLRKSSGGSGGGGGGHFTEVVQALARALDGHGFAMPPHLARVVRALAVLEGGATTLDPAFEVVPRVRASAMTKLANRNAKVWHGGTAKCSLNDGHVYM